MALGILGGMLRGAGNGTRENARQSIEDTERLRQEQAEEAKYQARLTDERADRDAHYAKVRAAQKEDLAANHAHNLKLAKLRSRGSASNSRNNTLLTNRVKSFETQGAKYLERIDEIATDSMLTKEQKLAAAAPLYARLDELVEGNPEMQNWSPLFGSFHSSAKGFISQFAQPDPSDTPPQRVTKDGFVVPKQITRVASSDGGQGSDFNADNYVTQQELSKKGASLLNNMKNNSRQDQLLDLYSSFQ